MTQDGGPRKLKRFEIALSRIGIQPAGMAFVDEHGKEAYYALYQEPYFIGVGVNGIGMQEVQLRNQRTGLIMASAGTEAVAIQRFEKMAHRKREGRPPEMAGGKAVKVYLDAESIAIATRLGNGNVSEGIRHALKKEC